MWFQLRPVELDFFRRTVQRLLERAMRNLEARARAAGAGA